MKGQESPAIQGWYSVVYNTFEPNPTTIYSKQINAGETFVWVLWPSEGKAPQIQTKIISKDEQSVTVKVTEAGKGSWEVKVPFMDSKAVEVKK